MGLQASYRAYQRRERECGKPDTVLPDLEEVTNDQLFFLSFANVSIANSDYKNKIVKITIIIKINVRGDIKAL